MMKKFLSKLACLCLALLLIVPCFRVTQSSASAASPLQDENEVNKFVIESILSDYLKFTNRVAGSDGEAQAAEYIWNALTVSGLTPRSFPSEEIAGYQSFRFTSQIDGLKHNSKNVVFEKKSQLETNKKVIIGCNYDALTFGDQYEVIEGQAINGSAGSVAVLLAIAKYISASNLDYNVEFVFFGAGESDCAGSKFYTDGISDKAKEDILLMINLENIAIGKNIYYYSDEISTDFSKFVGSVVSGDGLAAKEVDVSHLGKILLAEQNDLGLDYTHIAMNTNNQNFMKLGILSLNIFAGDYDSGLVLGRSEFEGKTAITYTANDNLAYILENFGEEAMMSNLMSVFSLVKSTLLNQNFVLSCEAAKGQTNSFYSFFGNEKVIIYITVCAFVVLVIVACFIYYKLAVRAYRSDIESQFAVSVISISENITRPDGNTKDVPKVVSQVIANDIKKDKQIKRKKKKDDK